MGVPPTIERPVDNDHLYRDPHCTLVVEHIVTQATSGIARDNHWMLGWVLARSPEVVHRRVHIVQEQGVNHLTNWGAMTKVASTNTMRLTQSFNLKVMTLAQRKQLEAIGNATQVRVPDGNWNCQDSDHNGLGSCRGGGFGDQRRMDGSREESSEHESLEQFLLRVEIFSALTNFIFCTCIYFCDSSQTCIERHCSITELAAKIEANATIIPSPKDRMDRQRLLQRRTITEGSVSDKEQNWRYCTHLVSLFSGLYVEGVRHSICHVTRW